MAKKIIKINTWKNIKVLNLKKDFRFLTSVLFQEFNKSDDIRDFVLNQKLEKYFELNADENKMYYHVDKVIKYEEHVLLEEWHVIPTNIIKINNYPIDYTFTTQNIFKDFPVDENIRLEILNQKLGNYYQISSINKIENGEEWNLKPKKDNINNFESENIITINGYPESFKFNVNKKFKPFIDDESENDDGRSEILFIKLYELNVYTNGHAYEDFVIENVIETSNGEEWILGS